MPAPPRTRLSRTLATLDGATERLARAVVTLAPWPVFYGMSLAVAGWVFTHPERLAQLHANKLTELERRWMAGGAGAAIVGVALVYFLVMLARRRRSGAWSFMDTVGRLNRALVPLLALPFVAALRLPNIEKDSPKSTLFYAALAAAAVGTGVYAWGRRRRLSPELEEAPGAARASAARALARGAPWLASLVLLALWAGYSLFFSRLAITNHHALHTRTPDLGYYDNIFYQSIHGNPLGCSFLKTGYHGSAHFDPILVLLSPLYLIYPRAEFLLVFQSLWLGAGVFPVYLLAREKLEHRGKALLLAVVWAIYPALHGANMYEFHSLALISPLVVWLLYFYETGRDRLYWVMLGVLLLCREDVSLLMCFIGLFAVLDRRAGRTRLGWVTIAVSLAYFVVVKLFFMTSPGIIMSGKDAYSYAYYYAELIPNRNGLGGLLISLLTNPVFALKVMLEEPKILFFLKLFLPLCFLPFVAKPGRWMLAYGLLFCLCASRDAVFSIHFQYSSILFPIAFALTPIGLKRVEDSGPAAYFGLDGRRLSRALLAATLVASALVSWKFGGLIENASFRGGFSRVARALTPEQEATYAWVREQAQAIPRDAIVGATSKMGPHISNRMKAYFYPGRAATVEYVLLDEGELKGKDLSRHKAAVKRGELVELSRRKKMALFKRGKPAEKRPPKDAAEPDDAPSGEPEEELGKPNKAAGGAPPGPESTAEQDEDPPPRP
ncbi:hypothetical protein SOCEGT47_066020 [Sorangium cellulosum]|uniref:DUF2079 domain-containing protein n=1 Tax=Sorangium cellulosum TaxID=56 RepID=A0A4P2Q952_SORCE|nr:DUF2079 domain-containing protein [Sorangium cellulosum]AUX26049.1 hypothetical protein SOCEGT47_066020 [Sorangium cellulosum]